jgi:8-oxo-dGTP pyrophosphatase MutT (NUDIX family)
MKRVDKTGFAPAGGTMRSQHGALCWRARGGATEVLLVTSRETGRWVIPKGWPMDGRDAPGTAAQEAWEEAGVRGPVDPDCLGVFTYDKVFDRGDGGRGHAVPCVVSVFALAVQGSDKSFPEKGQRRRRWFRQDKAAAKVDEPDLRALIAGFRPAGAPAAP